MSLHPDLKIKIPRETGEAKPYWDLVRKHGTSRKAMVDFIGGIGGYSSRLDRFAIEFNVKAWRANLDVDNLWKLLTSGKMDVGPDPKLPPEHLAQVKALFWRVYEEHKDHLWDWAIEEAYESWKDSDTPYETFTGERVDWEFGLYGRGGGHLCMTECEGINLACSSDDLVDKLMEKEPPSGAYVLSHADVRKLFIICVQNSIDLTPEKVSDEVEYRAAWRLWVSFCEDEVEKVINLYETREELSHHAAEIVGALANYGYDNDVEHLAKRVAFLSVFRRICELADVKIKGE